MIMPMPMSAAAAAQASDMALQPVEVRRLVSIGFYAVLNGKPEAGQRLFEALSVVRPDESFPRIGCALALMQRGRAEEAVRVLEDALGRCPNDDQVRVFLGMSLRLANRGSQAGAVLAPLAERSSDSAGTRFARQLLKLSL
jgi:Flp pilus assembly protein TadD